jgi:sugar O-acyltransferase (sialic acid O-acetyltransferase NeuD family)
MVIIGASGHAKEVFDICLNIDNLCFFDNVTDFKKPILFNKTIIQSFEELQKVVIQKDFILGLGGVLNRYNLFKKFTDLEFNPNSIIAKNAQVSSSALLSEGLNIMSFVFIGPNSKIGKGSLINVHATVHHDVQIGDFVEISPGAKILGNSTIGAFSTIGTNATILPKIIIGENVIVAAGSVVTKNVPDNCMVAGIPAVIKKQLPKLEF